MQEARPPHRKHESCDDCTQVMATRGALGSRRQRALDLAAQEADAMMSRMELFSANRSLLHKSHAVPWVGAKAMRVCGDPAKDLPLGVYAEPLGQPQVVEITRGRSWRYYTVLNCSRTSSRRQSFCLLAKQGITSAITVFARASDGLDFGVHSSLGMFAYDSATPPGESLSHNLAVLRLDAADEYVLMGGMQDFGLGKDRTFGWLEPAGARWGPYLANPRKQSGIRMVHGVGWPERCSRSERRKLCVLNHTNPSGELLAWPTRPEVVIHGDSPTGCIDRRPEHTGYPVVVGCEFDGRLSLVHRRVLGQRRFYLYARANLAERVMVGGRWVQVSQSWDAKSWEPWMPVYILGLPAAESDIYFFLVEDNPVHDGSLIALFPLSQAPDGCIAMAFSEDGIVFSRPYSLIRSHLGWRTSVADGSGPVEWRVQDHPAAGIFKAEGTDEVHFYVHHAVHGVSVGTKSRSYLARYSMPAHVLRRFTEDGLRSLREHPEANRTLENLRSLRRQRMTRRSLSHHRKAILI